MSTVEGASHSPQQSFSFFLKLLLNPRWLTLWRFLYCHPPLVYFGFSTKLWRWQFGRSAPIQPIMSCSFDSLLTWQTKLAPDKWSKDKTTENSTHLKCAFSAIIYKLKKVKKNICAFWYNRMWKKTWNLMCKSTIICEGKGARQVPTEFLCIQNSENLYDRVVQFNFDPVLVARSRVSATKCGPLAKIWAVAKRKSPTIFEIELSNLNHFFP